MISVDFNGNNKEQPQLLKLLYLNFFNYDLFMSCVSSSILKSNFTEGGADGGSKRPFVEIVSQLPNKEYSFLTSESSF